MTKLNNTRTSHKMNLFKNKSQIQEILYELMHFIAQGTQSILLENHSPFHSCLIPVIIINIIAPP